MNIYGLTGHKLGHSFSKKYFDDKFEKEKIEDCLFNLYPIDKIDQLPGLFHNEPQLKGLAVTIPYKQSVIPFLDKLSLPAKEMGAVNCIVNKSGELNGHNTDAIGFELSFLPLLKPHHRKAMVLGTGGASKAVLYVLEKHNIPFLKISRHEVLGGITYGELNKDIIRQHTVIINCSPVGMHPNDKDYPTLPYEGIGANHLMYDLVYNPENTMFMQLGRDRGATVKNGLEMLVLQAEENWKIWNN